MAAVTGALARRAAFAAAGALVALGAIHTAPKLRARYATRRIIGRLFTRLAAPRSGSLAPWKDHHAVAAREMERIGPEGVAAFIRELRAAEGPRRADFTRILLRLRPEMLLADAGLAASLAHDRGIQAHCRAHVAGILFSRIDRLEGPIVEPHLRTALRDEEPTVRACAACALWRLGARGPELVGPLADALATGFDMWEYPRMIGHDPDMDSLAETVALEALATCGERATAAAPILAAQVATGINLWMVEADSDAAARLLETCLPARALLVIGAPAGPALITELGRLPDEEEHAAARVAMLLLLDRMGGLTADLVLRQVSSEVRLVSRWGAWRTALFLLEEKPSGWWAHPDLAPGEDGSPPRCMARLSEKWVFFGLLAKDYDQLPRGFSAFGWRAGGGRKGRPWWTFGEYATWIKALGYRRASARLAAAWLIGTQALADTRARGSGDFPPALLELLDDPDYRVRAAAEWAVGVIKGEAAPARER